MPKDKKVKVAFIRTYHGPEGQYKKGETLEVTEEASRWLLDSKIAKIHHPKPVPVEDLKKKESDQKTVTGPDGDAAGLADVVNKASVDGGSTEPISSGEGIADPIGD